MMLPKFSISHLLFSIIIAFAFRLIFIGNSMIENQQIMQQPQQKEEQILSKDDFFRRAKLARRRKISKFFSDWKEKEEKLALLAVASVPMLEKYKPRLFSNVAEICAALSSHALPKLKKRFLKTEDGLPIGQFTDILFKQLFETHPRIIDDSECAYVVAMLQEMFYQIGKACRTFQ